MGGQKHVPSWGQPASLIEGLRNLAVVPTVNMKLQDSFDQRLLVSGQRANVETNQSAAEHEVLWGSSAGNMPQRSFQDYSTVTECC